MNKKIINFITIVILFILIFLAFQKYQLLQSSIVETSKLFLKNVFPFLFTMIIINNLLIEYNLPYYVNKIFHNYYIYIFIMSLLCGAPSNAIMINDFLNKKIINNQDASYLLSFTTFNSPLFLYYYFNLIFHSYQITLKLFMIIYLENIGLFLFFKRKLSKNNYQVKNTNHTFFTAITNCIQKATANMVNVYATILTFQLFCDLTLPKNTILRGFVEITQGLNIISQINASLKIKELLTLVILSFSGLSIHIQISNILSKHSINYKYFYLSRIIIGIVPFYLLPLK